MDKLLKEKLDSGREYRNMTMEIRAGESGEGEMIVEGYASTFNEPYTIYSGKFYEIKEQVDPAAFNDCDMSDVIMQYDHEGRVFARNSNNTLAVKADSKGLLIRADLSGTEMGRQLYEEIKGGYTNKMSFGFTVAEDVRTITDNVDDEKEICLRTITKIGKLYDVSAVSLPANDMTSISARKFSDGLIAEFEAERLMRQKRKQRIKLLLEV